MSTVFRRDTRPLAILIRFINDEFDIASVHWTRQSPFYSTGPEASGSVPWLTLYANSLRYDCLWATWEQWKDRPPTWRGHWRISTSIIVITKTFSHVSGLADPELPSDSSTAENLSSADIEGSHYGSGSTAKAWRPGPWPGGKAFSLSRDSNEWCSWKCSRCYMYDFRINHL